MPAVGPWFLTRPLRLELRLGRGASRPPSAFARVGAGSRSRLPNAPQTSLSFLLSSFSSLLYAFVLLLGFLQGARNEAGPLQSRSCQRTQSSEHVSEKWPGKRAPRVAPCRKPTLFVRLGLLSLARKTLQNPCVCSGVLWALQSLFVVPGESPSPPLSALPGRGTGVPACFRSKES